MRKFLLTFLLWAAALAYAGAQISIEVLLDESEFLRDESLLLKVRLVNRSGQTLKLGTAADWLTFHVQGQDNRPVDKSGEVPVTGEFTVESSQSATKTVNLMPWFQFPQPGRYSVTATVRIPQWQDEIVSVSKNFYIIRGSPDWEQDFGVPRKEGVPEVRHYSLIRATGMKQTRLYVRVSDAQDSHVFQVKSLGQVVSFGKPEALVDKVSQLHVLLQNGPRNFAYSVFNPDGDLLLRQSFEYTDTRPGLKIGGSGQILVVGGQRHFAATDYPALNTREPVETPATGTPGNATNRVVAPVPPKNDAK